MNFNNNNSKVISKLSKGIIKKNKVRNIFSIIAIILTTFLISSVFTIGINFYNNYSVMQKRITGTVASVFLSNPTDDQIEKLQDLNICDSIGGQINAGKIKLDDDNKKSNVSLIYYDDICFNKHIMPCISNVKGNYPESKNEMMLSEDAIKILSLENINIGDSFTVKYMLNNKEYKDEFILSGTYRNYPLVQGNGIGLVSKDFLDDNNLSLEKNGVLSVLPKKEYSESMDEEIKNSNLYLKEDQSIEYGYSVTDVVKYVALTSGTMALIITLFIIISGYLLIYNIIYISVIKDINFYGLLKTIGTSPKQIKKIVKKQANIFSIIGIPIGLIISSITSFFIVPLTLKVVQDGTGCASDYMPNTVSFNPIIFILAILFSYFTVRISCRKSAKIAGNISPVEALRYSVTKSKKGKKTRNSKNAGKIYKMSWYNIFRDKKRAILVFTSLFMGIITFICVNTFLSCISVDNFINDTIRNDFTIKTFNEEDTTSKANLSNNEQTNEITSDSIEEIKNLQGIKEINVLKYSFLNFDYKIFDKYLDIYFKETKMPEDMIVKLKGSYEKNNGKAGSFINSIDNSIVKNCIKKYNLNINIDDFINGNIAILQIPENLKEYYDDLKDDLDGREITLNSPKVNSNDDIDNMSLTLKLKVILDDNKVLPHPKAYTDLPNIYISNDIGEEKHFKNGSISINVDENYEKEISSELKEICNRNHYDLESKSEQKASFSNMKVVIGILGGGIAFILILIGLINFVNVMITGINVRLSEFAVLESIGMTKKQQNKMVTIEGLYYGLISTIFLYTIGSVVMYLFTLLTKQIVSYAEFSYPIVQMVLLTLSIMIICIVTPVITLKVSSKNSITERLRRTEA